MKSPPTSTISSAPVIKVKLKNKCIHNVKINTKKIIGESGKSYKNKVSRVFPLWCHGLRIWHCLSCSIGLSCSSDSTPGQGTSICHGCSRKRKKKISNAIKTILRKHPSANRGIHFSKCWGQPSIQGLLLSPRWKSMRTAFSEVFC